MRRGWPGHGGVVDKLLGGPPALVAWVRAGERLAARTVRQRARLSAGPQVKAPLPATRDNPGAGQRAGAQRRKPRLLPCASGCRNTYNNKGLHANSAPLLTRLRHSRTRAPAKDHNFSPSRRTAFRSHRRTPRNHQATDVYGGGRRQRDRQSSASPAAVKPLHSQSPEAGALKAGQVPLLPFEGTSTLALVLLKALKVNNPEATMQLLLTGTHRLP